MKMTCSLERVRELLNYCPETGEFRWAVDRTGKTKAGDLAGTVNVYGYRQISLDNKVYKAHRIAFALIHGAWPERDIDHINGFKLDNRGTNLRMATRSENEQNTLRPHKDSMTGFLGVYQAKEKFVARIQVNGRSKHLGRFDSPERAHAAYLKAKSELHPFAPNMASCMVDPV